MLLPGLDGTGTLFAPFMAAAPAGFPVQALAFLSDRSGSYRELADWVASRLPADPIALIAESFSGPLAILVADKCPQVAAVILCASFVKAPLPRFLSCAPELVFGRSPPTALVSFFLTGGDRELAEAVRRVLKGVPAGVIAARIAAALRVDVSEELQRLPQPVLYLRARNDRLVPARSAAMIRSLTPSVEFAEVDGPHLLLQTQPADAWSHIRPFLERSMLRAG
jgi:pimeloyl-ACP methyl ester carboxylesterase